MTTARSVEHGRAAGADILAFAGPSDRTMADAGGSTDAGVNDIMFDLGGDERRMHVRAYNHWVSLLDGRPYPSIANLEPETITDFGPHSVLLDFSHGMGDPKIAYLGRALREECGLEGPIATIADVPSRSLLSRLTDHYLQIIANRAPIGFEAEFVSSRGRTTLYRGILMPFASGGVTIDFIYGVINWKELADADLQAALSAELDAAVQGNSRVAGAAAQVWADGPSGGFDVMPAEPAPVEALVLDEPLPAGYVMAGPFGEQLAMARESAAQVRAAEARSRAALHRTLGRAHDLAVSAEHDDGDLATVFKAACLPGQADVMMQIVTLVFGATFETARLEMFAAVLRHAQRHQVPAGGFASFIVGFDGDIAAIAAAERSAS
ncbi:MULTISPECIES: hypothetical protein [Sphingomonas]|uniref:PAS domain-containing protein n=1 Tax=Sphingomonas TaxID=13687 RepID=UPI0010455E4C|nr:MULTISPECIES: hypothetical protein [Sphingomonas]